MPLGLTAAYWFMVTDLRAEADTVISSRVEREGVDK